VTAYQFELSFFAVDGDSRTFRVHARCDLGSAEALFEVPGTPAFEQELTNVGIFVAFSSGTVVHRTRAGQLEEPVRSFGKWLARAVFTPEVRTLYWQLEDEARLDDQSASIVLQVGDPLLQRLPVGADVGREERRLLLPPGADHADDLGVAEQGRAGQGGTPQRARRDGQPVGLRGARGRPGEGAA
jgi:hypothetical protein